MQRRAGETELNMFEWGHEARLMTVIRGIPIYRSSGKNSGFKNTWFPHLGIDGTRWVRKPRLCLPQDIIAFCKNINLDKIIALCRFGNTQSICISASIGTGFWMTNEGIALKRFLKEKYQHYFLSNYELLKFHNAIKSPSHGKVKDIATANSYLMQYGSWVSTEFRGRLPSDVEYSFFVIAENQRIRTALSMMLASNSRITTESYKMICKLSENPALLDYALNNGLLETQKNINRLTNMMIKHKKTLKIHDLISLDSLNYILLPFHYKYFKSKYPCRKILRKLHPTALTTRTFEIMEKLDHLYLLDRYAELFLNDEARLGLIYLDNLKQLNCKMIKELWQTYLNYKQGIHPENPDAVDTKTNIESRNSTLKTNSLFTVNNKTIDYDVMANQPASKRLSNFAKR